MVNWSRVEETAAGLMTSLGLGTLDMGIAGPGTYLDIRKDL